jgi:outer membrane protein assembly factor BamB
MLPLRHAATASLTALVLSATLHAANWPQWRGPDGQGISTETSLPSEWSSGRNIAWKTPIPGRGHSSPIVWGNHVFLTTAVEGDVVPGAKAPIHYIQEDKAKPPEAFLHPDSVGADRKHTYKVIAVALDTGKVLWERVAYEGVVFDNRHKSSSYASPTPVTDGTLVYAYFGSEGLYAYDYSGTLEWKADIGDFKTLGMGTSTSPVLYRNLVILQCDENNGDASFIVALDKTSGREVWRVKRDVQVSWATPVLVEAGGRTELVTSGFERIHAYDPATGKELWRTKGVESNSIHTPLVGHGLVIVTAGYPAKRVIALRPGGSGDITGTDRVVWTYEKGTAYVASPILYGDYLYLLTDAGIVTCLDVKTGAVKYEGGRPPEPARFMGSPVAWGGNIYFTSTDGDTFVVKAGPTHEVVRTNTVDEPVYASLAPAQGRVLIRALGHLYCVKAV